jgi:hypothetical protein
LISCAIVAAISPTAARRSRRRSRSSICSTWVEEQRRADRLAVVVAHQRQGVADHRVGGLEAQLGAVGQRLQLEGAAEHADDVRMLAKNVGIGQPVDGAGFQVKEPARLVVQQDEAALPVDGQHAIAHVSHHVAEEHVQMPGRLSGWLGHQHVAEPG